MQFAHNGSDKGSIPFGLIILSLFLYPFVYIGLFFILYKQKGLLYKKQAERPKNKNKNNI